MDEFEEDGPIVSVIKVFPGMRFAKWLILKGFQEMAIRAGILCRTND